MVVQILVTVQWRRHGKIPLKVSDETGIDLVMKLANSIVKEGVVLADWEFTSIVNSYKGKGGALERGKYRA